MPDTKRPVSRVLTLLRATPQVSVRGRPSPSGRGVLAYATVYRAVFPNGFAYIGATTQPLKRRIAVHMSAARCYAAGTAKHGSGNPDLKEALLAFEGKIKWEIIAKVPVQHAGEIEARAIVRENTMTPNGYNINPGGAVFMPGSKRNKRISKALTGVPKSESHRQAIARSNRESPRVCGYPWKPETVARRAREKALRLEAQDRAQREAAFYDKSWSRTFRSTRNSYKVIRLRPTVHDAYLKGYKPKPAISPCVLKRIPPNLADLHQRFQGKASEVSRVTGISTVTILRYFRLLGLPVLVKGRPVGTIHPYSIHQQRLRRRAARHPERSINP